MSEFAGLPLWVWVVIAVIIVLIFVGAVVWFAYGRRVFARRVLVGIIGRRESVRASRRTFEAVMRHLADESDEDLYAFASDPGSEDRRSLIEVRDQMWVIVDELDTRSMPRHLIEVAEELADAAYVIGEQAGLLGDDMDAQAVLAALAQVDMGRVSSQSSVADDRIDEACTEFGVEDASVYGGGLYI